MGCEQKTSMNISFGTIAPAIGLERINGEKVLRNVRISGAVVVGTS